MNSALNPFNEYDALSLVSVAVRDTDIIALTGSTMRESPSYAVSFSSGIRSIRHINAFLGVSEVVSPVYAFRKRLPVSSVVVWGRKQNSKRALRYATAHKLPVLYVEDGWIRSCSADSHSRVSYSLLVDDQGVYYDSTAPSSLESFLNLSDDEFSKHCTPEALTYAATCRRILVDNNITKYNYCQLPDPRKLHCDDRPLVLVLDQTRDDASVRFGAMDAESFSHMLERAVQENPGARVLVRTHPDVVSGRRDGYLQQRASELGVELSGTGDNPIAWLKKADVVYVGTSQLGYEALLCGCTVKVSGRPFYAGWGLTEDFQSIKRRIRLRTLDQLFHATHVHHARYCCPVTSQPWLLHNVLEHVKLQQHYFQRNSGNRVATDVTLWKRKYIARFLRSPYGSLRFSNRSDVGGHETPVRWSFSDDKVTWWKSAPKLSGEISTNTKCMRVEDGFIRSSGLGSDFTPPASLVFDESGLYFDAGAPSRLEELLNTYRCTEEELRRARNLKHSLLKANLTKYNVGSYGHTNSAVDVTALSKTKILVVGQVEGDQSILRGSPEIKSNAELLQVVRKHNPSAFIVYKPHPDVVSGNRKGDVDTQTLESCVDLVEHNRHFPDCLEDSDELHTVTSLSGFEALLRGKKVVTYGLPFYAGWGLTTDRIQCERRRQSRTIDELVYLSLILYPHYVDLESGEFMTIEQLVFKMALSHARCVGRRGPRWIVKLNNIAAALLYRA